MPVSMPSVSHTAVVGIEYLVSQVDCMTLTVDCNAVMSGWMCVCL